MLFSSSSLSAIRVATSVFLRLLIISLGNLWFQLMTHPAWHFAQCTLHVIKWAEWQYTALSYSLILNQSFVPCLVLTVASWLAYRFLRRQVRWSGTPISLRIFQVCCDPHSPRGFSIVKKVESTCFSGILLLSPWSNECWQFDLGFLCVFSEPSLSIYKFLAHVLLKPSLNDFDHNLASMWNELNYTVVWMFFDIAFLWKALSPNFS